MADGDDTVTGGDGGKPDPLAAALARIDEQNARLNAFERETAELRGQVNGLKERPAPQQPATPEKEYTRGELDQLVADGRVSQIDADRLYERQIERRTEKKATEVAERAIENRTSADKIGAAIDAYAAALPEILVDRSEQRDRVKREFDYLVGLGHPEDKRTELAALRAAFGPVDAIKRGNAAAHETHQDVGSGGRTAGEKQTVDPSMPKDIPPERVPYYRDAIRQGRYKDWDEVRAELKWAGRGRRAA